MQIKDMYHTFFAPKMVPLRKDWSNLSDDKCFIAPDQESQDKASDQERKRQKPEEEKSPVERHAHENPAACSRVCEAWGLEISPEEYDSVSDDASDRHKLIMSKYEEKSKDKNWNKERRCFQWKYHKGVCCTARSFKLGVPKREEKDENKYTSGWFVKGINNWIEGRGECSKVEWKEPR